MQSHYQQVLIDDLGACENDEEIAYVFDRYKSIIDGSFVCFFINPLPPGSVLQEIMTREKIARITHFVREYVRNIVDRYLEVPQQDIDAFVQGTISLLLVQHSFNHISSLLELYKTDKEKEFAILVRLRWLMDYGVKMLMKTHDIGLIKKVIDRGPSFFDNRFVIDLLNNKRVKGNPDEQRSTYIIQAIADYRNRFPLEQVADTRLVYLINQFNVSDAEEVRLKILHEALSIAGAETEEVVANINLLLGKCYSDRSNGLKYQNIKEAVKYFQIAGSVYNKEEHFNKWCFIQKNLGDTYLFMHIGAVPENIEKAIGYYNNALEGITREYAPYDWSVLQSNLGIAFLKRFRGNNMQNIRHAFSHLKEALSVLSLQYTPQEWATNMMRLGDAYNNRHDLERPVNAQKAVYYYEQALTVYKRELDPAMWGMLKAKIGDAYSVMAGDQRAENLEKGLNHVMEALAVLQPSLSAHGWELAQSVLAQIYLERVYGERIENIEKAISLFQSISLAIPKDQVPYDWALNQQRLASCYRARLRGTEVENHRLAMEHIEQSLTVFDQQQSPVDWAKAQHLLGILHLERTGENKAEDYEQAIKCFQSALEVRTWDNSRYSWSETMNCLGNAYRLRINGDISLNVERSIECFKLVIGKIQLEENPELWAILHSNIGISYTVRVKGKKDDNDKQAIDFYRKALLVHTPDQNPIECYRAAFSLGKLYFFYQDYIASQNTLELCHQSVENLRAQSAREVSRWQIAFETTEVYEVLVASCLNTGDIEKAFYYVTAAKARLFTDKLGGDAEKPAKQAASDPEFAKAWDHICQLQLEMDQLTSQLRLQYSEDIENKLHNKRKEHTIELRELFYRFPEISLSHNAPIPEPDLVKQLAAKLNGAVLIEYFKCANGWVAFIIMNDRIECINLPEVSKGSVDLIVSTMLEYEQGVIDNKPPVSFINQLSIALGKLYDYLIRPLEIYLPQEGTLVLAPSQDLHLLPFTIAYDNVRHQYLIDRFTISYMPSLGALENLNTMLDKNGQESMEKSLLSVVYSAQDTGMPLRYALREAMQIAAHFLAEPKSIYLHEQNATSANVLKACDNYQFDTLHFSCHGQYNGNDPANSGLRLTDSILTAERISTELRLSNFPTVILSACQSGISQPVEGDEAIGLIQSFFNAGAGSIISSQWSVEDNATQVLFEKFYEYRKSLNAPEALRQAMFAIRKKEGWNYPIYWAAFKFTGLDRTRYFRE